MSPEQQRALAVAKARRRRAETEAAPPTAETKKKPSIARQGEAALRGVTSGLLGVGDYAAAAGDVVGAQVIRPLIGKERLPLNETMQRVRGDRRALEQDAPVASAVGNVAGALVPISRVGQLANRLGVGLKTGKPLTNTLKTAGVAGAQGAVTAANLGASPEEIAQSGGVGAVLGPAAGAAVRVGGAGVGLVRSIADRNKDAGFKALAKALSKEGKRVSPTALKERAAEFKRITGRMPTVTEIVGERGGQDILETVQSGSRATERLLSAAEEQGQALQGNLAGRIRRGKAVPVVEKLSGYRKIAADKAMGKIGKKTVAFDAKSVDELLQDQDVQRALPADAQDILRQLVDTGGNVPVRLVEDMRQIFRTRGNKAGGVPRKFREFADSLVEGASEQVPEYGRYLTSYGRRSEGIKGVKFGEKIDNMSVEDVEYKLSTAKPAFVGGARAKNRGALVNQALESPQSATRLARSLAEDSGKIRKQAALDPQEAARLRELGQSQTDALESVGATVRGARVKSASQEEIENIKTVMEGVFGVASGRGSAGFQVNFASKLVQRFRVPPTAALRLTEALTDPARTDEAIELLIKHGVSPTAIQEMAQSASRVAARTTGPATVQE